MESSDATYAPLQGFLEEEGDEQLRVRVPHGVWIVDRADVVEVSDWEEPVTSGADMTGRPVRVTTRDGAELGFLQKIRTRASERPMTLPGGRLSEIAGRSELDDLGRTWAGRMGFELLDAGAGSSPSACCWETGEWQTDCSPDDCMD